MSKTKSPRAKPTKPTKTARADNACRRLFIDLQDALDQAAEATGVDMWLYAAVTADGGTSGRQVVLSSDASDGKMRAALRRGFNRLMTFWSEYVRDLRDQPTSKAGAKGHKP